MANFTSKSKTPSWELNEAEEKIWQKVAATKYSQSDNETLLTSTQNLEKNILGQMNSTAYRDSNARVKLQEDLYTYQKNILRLKARGYDTAKAEENFGLIQNTADKQNQTFASFKTAEEYGYYTKYNGKSYDDINKYLASDEYKTMRKDGRISDEEDIWLKNFETNIATADQIQSKIDALGGKSQWLTQINNAKKAMTMSEGEKRRAIINGTYNSTQETARKQIAEAEEKVALIEILETTKEKKQQLEQFSKKWDDEVKGLDNTISVPTNDQLKSVLVTDDEVGFLAEAASNASDGTPAGQAGAVIGKFISDIIKDSRDETDFEDYAGLLSESEKKNIINLAKTNRVKATEYFNDLITIRLDEEYNEQIKADAAGFTSQNQLFAKLGSVGSVVTSLGSGLETVGNWLTGNTDRRSRLASTTTGLREGTKTHWDGTWGEEAWDFLYDTGMSAADSLAAAGLSTVVPFSGEILLGASAAANTYNDMLDRGVTGGDAILGSVAAGVAEGLFEHISIGQLPSLKAGNLTGGFTKAGLKQLVKESGKQILVNASEEALTEISNIITDNLISGDLSSYAIAAEQYYMQGYSAEEAKKMAAQDLGKQVAMAGLSGALMGFGFGAGGSVVGLSNSNIKNSKAGNAVLNTENGLDTLKSIANKSGFKDIANEAEKLTENSKPSEVGYVFNRLYEQSVEKSIDAMLPELTENGATKGGSNSARGWASQIIKTAIAPESDDKRSKANNLRANKVTSNVYAAFADEGKYGAGTIFELNDLIAFKPATKEQIAERMGSRMVIDKKIEKYSKDAWVEDYEANRPTFGTNELSAEVRDNLNKITANGTSGPVSQIFGKNVAANFEKQRPAPQKSDKIKITPKGERIVKQRGKAMGVKVIFTDDLVDGIGDGKTVDHKIVTISRYSVNPMKELIKHEFTHTTEISKFYAKFSSYILNDSKAFAAWIKQKGYANWAELQSEIIESFHKNKVTYKNEPDAAKREIIAMFVSENLFNEKTANEEITVDFLSELRRIDRAWYERLIDWVKSVFARLKTVDGVQRDIIKLEQQFLRLVETASAERLNDKSGEIETNQNVQFSTNSFTEQVDAVLDGADTVSTHLRIAEHTPKLLLDLGLSDKPILITSVHTKTAVGYNVKGKNIHSISKETFKKLPQLIEKPAIIMESTKPGSVIMFVNAVDANNIPVLCAIKVDGNGFYNNVSIEANVVTSVYGKDTNPIGFIKKAVEENRVLYWDKKMSQELFDIPGLQLPDNIYNLDSNTIIRKLNVNVNNQYLFAGQNAKTANKLTLATAKQMLKDGTDSETIRQETGWFKGYDGKWRFEISDKDIKILTKYLKKDVLKIFEFEQARQDVLNGEITVDKFKTIAEEYLWSDTLNRTIKDYINHEKLFEAYPEIENMRMRFEFLKNGARGAFDPATNTLIVNCVFTHKYTSYEDELKKAIIHELQHLVQAIEGFAKGSSGVDWQKQIERGNMPRYKNGEPMDDIMAYRYTAGEMEAFDAEHRFDLNDDERKEKRPDIDNENVIFVEDNFVNSADGVQYSISNDHVYSYNNGKASFTEDRLNSLLDEHSLGDGKRADYSNAFIAYISPGDFVNLTSNDRIRGRVEDEAYVLNEDELRNESETPFIEYDPATGEVVNHEGRHRMVALQAEGINSVAVVLKPSTDSFARLEPQDINLTGQNFADGKAKGNVTVKNAIPLSEKYRDEITAQFAQNPDADVRYSIPSGRYADYDKPITIKDIEVLRSIGRKSINNFASEDIEKAQKWAYKFYQQLGVKSPFFRAWFGDWRAYDKTPITIANKKGDARGLHKNTDTGWNISISRKVFNETTSHNGIANIEAKPYLPFINDIVQNAVLLDTVISNKENQSLFMHTFYAVVDIGKGPELLKLYVEELNNPNSHDDIKRAYQLQNIEKKAICCNRVGE